MNYTSLSLAQTVLKRRKKNLDAEGRSDEIVVFVPLEESDDRMKAVAGVLEMAFELEIGNSHPTVKNFLLEIFMAGRNSVKKQ